MERGAVGGGWCSGENADVGGGSCHWWTRVARSLRRKGERWRGTLRAVRDRASESDKIGQNPMTGAKKLVPCAKGTMAKAGVAVSGRATIVGPLPKRCGGSPHSLSAVRPAGEIPRWYRTYTRWRRSCRGGVGRGCSWGVPWHMTEIYTFGATYVGTARTDCAPGSFNS